MSLPRALHKVNDFIEQIVINLMMVGRSVPKPNTNLKTIEKYRKSVGAFSNQAHISFLKNGNPNGMLFVMVHGTPGSAAGWADYIEDPPLNSEVIAIDRLGFGKSITARSFPKLDDQVSALHQIIPSNKKNIILVGHSLGGPIVARYAAKYPDQVQSVIFLAASVDPSQEKTHLIQYFANWPFIRIALPRFIRNANEELMSLKPELEELAPLLNQIKAKVIIVHGDQDNLVPVENVYFLQTHLTSAKCIETIVIPGHNHFLPWNAQATVRKAMDLASEAIKSS